MKDAVFAIIAMCGAAVLAGPSVSLPPFTITGRIVNFDRQSVSEVASGDAEIRAYKSDGTLVARSLIATETNFTENYRLVVPLASASNADARGAARRRLLRPGHLRGRRLGDARRRRADGRSRGG